MFQILYVASNIKSVGVDRVNATAKSSVSKVFRGGP
jgi:hypothetical protein